MRQITQEIFTFSELEPAAQKRAIDDYQVQYREMLHEDANQDIECVFVWALDKRGYPTWDIRWSLSYCQGDGVAFYSGGRKPPTQHGCPLLDDSSSGVNVQRLWWRGLAKHFSKPERRAIYQVWSILRDNLHIRIEPNHYGHHYSHARTMEVGVSLEAFRWDDYPEIAEHLSEQELDHLLVSAESWIAYDVRDVSRGLEQEGYRILEEALSDPRVTEYMQEQDDEYLQDGTRFG